MAVGAPRPGPGRPTGTVLAASAPQAARQPEPAVQEAVGQEPARAAEGTTRQKGTTQDKGTIQDKGATQPEGRASTAQGPSPGCDNAPGMHGPVGGRPGHKQPQSRGPGAGPARGIPQDGQLGGPAAPEAVNLNTAGLEELEALPGIGPALARRIVAFREQHGPFRRVDDLLEVPGIGPVLLQRLRGRVRVDTGA